MKIAAAFRSQNLLFSLCVFISLAFAPMRAFSVQSVPLTWNASNDPNVIGYRIYYGGASGYYTNSVTVGNVTNTVITGLQDNTTYYFAAKGYDSAGDESDFSNEASLSSASVAYNGQLIINTSPFTNNNNGQYVFSLGGGTPSGYWINASTGMLYWGPCPTNTSTTNNINIVITDTQNQNVTMLETYVITIHSSQNDYLAVSLGSTIVQAGQTVSLPISLNSSTGATNLTFVIGWPCPMFTNITLTLNDSSLIGQVFTQGTNLIVQIGNASIASGSNILGQLNFQVAASQNSGLVYLPLIAVEGVKADATTYNNVTYSGSEVMIVGNNPMLVPAAPVTPPSGTTHALTVYGIPQANYLVQYTTNLTPPIVWQPSIAFTQTNLVQTINLPGGSPTDFYRLVQQ
jgi:hypothetical protein